MTVGWSRTILMGRNVREIILDTETTGLDAKGGDRLIEIGCVELINRIPSGREFHAFLNPEGREVHPDAEAIHGLSAAFLADKPRFADIANQFLDFIADAPLVIHNATFDIGFINAELQRQARPEIGMHRVVDTLALARRKHPAVPNSLDALCKRYGIDNSQRTKHGAIMDSLLLASVYVELLGERQAALHLGAGSPGERMGAARAPALQRPSPLPPRPERQREEQEHMLFVETLGPKAIWKRFTAVLAGVTR
jgi:DNA polymerase-3 subunit epsilon